MAKASSPVRLQRELMQAAAITGDRFCRSATEQVEYWASIGRRVAGVLDADVLLSVVAGLSKVRVEPVVGKVIDPEDVFQALEAKRSHGTLSPAITTGTVRYQTSLSHPGYLEQIDDNGQIATGHFVQGVFLPSVDLDR